MSAEENSSLAPVPGEPSDPASHSSEPQFGGVAPQPVLPGPTDGQPSSKRFPPENFNVPWGWLDIAIIVPYVIAMILAFGLIISGLTLVLLRERAGYIHAHRLFIGILAQILAEISLLAFLALLIRYRSNRPFWSTIGWRPLRPRTTPRATAYLGLILGGIGLALLVSSASIAFPPKHPLPIEQIYTSRPLTLLFMFTAVAIAPLVEETIFRGYLYPVAARSFGIVAGIVFTGAVFGLLHGIQLWGGWWQIGLLVMVGIIFTYARAVTRTVFSSFTLHVSYNSVQVIAMLYALYGPQHLPHVH